MDFNLTNDQLYLKKSVIEFSKLHVGGKSGTYDFKEYWKRCAEFGLFSMAGESCEPEGSVDPLSLMVAIEALGYGCKDNGFVFAINNHIFACQLLIQKYGSSEQKDKYLPRLQSGDLIGAHAMTEAGSGSDSFQMRTTARLEGDSYVLNGSKLFVSNAPIADVFIVFAKTGEGSASQNVSAFIVEKGFPGFSVGNSIAKMGLKSSPISELIFNDCKVPVENLLLNAGSGFFVFNTAVEYERAYIFASNLGAMKRNYESVLDYVKNRRQFGVPIAQFQSISHKIADIRVQIEVCELLLYKIGWLKSTGQSSFYEASMAKLLISESYVKEMLNILQMYGAYGYMEEYGIEEELRDALASTIYSGTSEIQRNIIASWCGL